MRKYADIHTHILPGIDDGAGPWEETMKMVEQIYDEGVRFVFATPHYGKFGFEYDQKKVLRNYKKLKEFAKEFYPDMRFFLGNELFYDSDSVKHLREGEAFTLGNTDYVLIEFSSSKNFEEMINGVRDLKTAGYHPIVAHIERLESLRQQPDLVIELIHAGAYTQINARSFLGSHMDKKVKWCNKIFKRGWVHFIASDCHDTEERAPVMKQTIDRLLKKFDRRAVDQVLIHNVATLMQNKPI